MCELSPTGTYGHPAPLALVTRNGAEGSDPLSRLCLLQQLKVPTMGTAAAWMASEQGHSNGLRSPGWGAHVCHPDLVYLPGHCSV